LTGYTCAAGYTQFTPTTDKVGGCLACSGMKDAKTNNAITGYVSCS